jgi:hypothetical protein
MTEKSCYCVASYAVIASLFTLCHCEPERSEGEAISSLRGVKRRSNLIIASEVKQSLIVLSRVTTRNKAMKQFLYKLRCNGDNQ